MLRLAFNKNPLPFHKLAVAIGFLLSAVQPPVSAQSGSSASGASALDGLPVIAARLTLSDAIHLADENNVSLAQVRAGSESARADSERAKAALSPSISTTTYATTGSESSIVTSAPGAMPQNIFGVPRNGYADQDLTLMVPLTSGGSLQKRAAGAAGTAKGAMLDVDASRLLLRKAVTEAYANVLLQNALVTSARSRVTTDEEQVRITQEKVNTGRLAPVDLLREQAELADAQSGAAQADATLEMALVDLKLTLGVSQTSTIQLTDTLDMLLAGPSQSPPPATLADAIHAAMKNRPEIAAAQQRVNIASALVSAARGEFSPQAYAVGMADAAGGQGMRGQTGYTVGLAASLTLYDGGARKADVSSASAILDRARADARAAEQTVERDIAKAWYASAAVQSQVASAHAGLIAAQQGYFLADLRYNAGKSTTAERLDALGALTRATGILAQAKAAQVNAYSGLLYAEGG